MEPIKFNVSDIIGKWSSHHSSSTPLNGNFDSSNQDLEVGSQFSNIQRRKNAALRKGHKRDRETLEVEKALQKQNRFSLSPPVLKNPSKEYQIHICKKCQNLLEYVTAGLNKGLMKSQTLDLLNGTDNEARYFSSPLFFNFAKQYSALCFQSLDKSLLKSIKLNDHPVIFVHQSEDVFTTLLLHFYLLCMNEKFPVTVVKDLSLTQSCVNKEQDVSSPTLRYFLQKLGFLFLQENSESDIEKITQILLDELDKSASILIPRRPYSLSSSTTPNIFDQILKAQRENDSRLNRTVIATMVSSKEAVSNLQPFSLFQLLPSVRSCNKLGLIHINVSHFIKLKSFVKVASDLNQQNEVAEENNLISRHINFDMMETKLILPVHIVSSILLTKYREKEVSLSDLIIDIDNHVTKLKDMQKDFGFLGGAEDIAKHAIEILQQQSLLEFNGQTNYINVNLPSVYQSKVLFDHSIKVIHTHMPRAILASSIISSCGGERIIRQRSTSDISFVGSKVLESAEFLAEMISFLLDFHCPFNEMGDTLTTTLDYFVGMDYVKMKETGYDDNFHQRLAYSATLNCAIGEEDALDGRRNEINYELAPDYHIFDVFFEYSAYVKPFIELCFIVLAIIRENMKGKEFSATDLYEAVNDRYQMNFFKYGEMVQLEFVSRFCDYLFEMEVIDDVEESYTLSEKFQSDDELLLMLQQIGDFR